MLIPAAAAAGVYLLTKNVALAGVTGVGVFLMTGSGNGVTYYRLAAGAEYKVDTQGNIWKKGGMMNTWSRDYGGDPELQKAIATGTRIVPYIG